MHMRPKYWLSPSGDWHAVQDHTTWEIKGFKNGKVPQGWVRIVTDGKNIYAPWGACNNRQRREIKDSAIMAELGIIDDASGRPVEESEIDRMANELIGGLLKESASRQDLEAYCQYLHDNETKDERRDTWSLPDGGGDSGTCTNAAILIAQKFGGKVVGYSSEENDFPETVVCYDLSGHDFALVGQYLVDWWNKYYTGDASKCVYDLKDASDAAEVAKLYPPPNDWVAVWPKSEIKPKDAPLTVKPKKPFKSFKGRLPESVDVDDKGVPYRVGYALNEPEGRCPSVNWDAKDVQITGKWTPAKIREFLSLSPDFQSIYRALVPLSDLDESLSEENDPDFADDEGSGYDWSELQSRRSSPPPVLVLRKEDGSLELCDGNHRVRFWINSDYDEAPAWVVDLAIEAHLKANKGKPDFSDAVEESIQTDNAAFQAWFRGSKVVDSDGHPLAVFHAAKAPFTVFDPKFKTDLSSMGFHFGTSDQANFRMGQYDFDSKNPTVGKYYLAIRKPLKVSHMASFAPDHLADQMFDMGFLDEDKFMAIRDRYSEEPAVGRELVKILKKKGYDGLVYDNDREGTGSTFVPFDANQIKSATGNRGTFDPESDHIGESADALVADMIANPAEREKPTEIPDNLPITQTPAFKAWFDNSVVYDHVNQRPKVVYHGTVHWPLKDGTTMGKLTAFNRLNSMKVRGKSMDGVGSWFSDLPGEDGAQIYAGGKSMPTDDRWPGSSIYPVYLSIQNPIKLTFEQFLKMGQEASGWQPFTKPRRIPATDWDGKPVINPKTGKPKTKMYKSAVPKGLWDPDFLRDKLKSEGYDGIIFPPSEKLEGGNHTVYVAFDANQIKSAIANRGTFSRDSDHIGEAKIGLSLTPEFHKWFKKSRVVNSDGSPQVMYHGTLKGGFQEFYPGSHFGTPEAASKMAGQGKYQRELGTTKDGGSIYPVYLSIQRPKRMGDPSEWDWKGRIERAKKQGYDGIVYRNRRENLGSDSWIAFYPHQIKSSIGNNGIFSSQSNHIGESEEGLYKLGRLAYRRGKTLEDNPCLSSAWIRGWKSSKADDEAGNFRDSELDESEKPSRFQMPENSDPLKEINKDVTLFVGGNDWEESWTWAWVESDNYGLPKRVWMSISYEDCVCCPDCDEARKHRKELRAHAEKVVDQWIAAAKSVRSSGEKKDYYSHDDYKPELSIGDFFEALKSGEMSGLVKDFGIENQVWKPVEDVVEVAEDIDLESDQLVEILVQAPDTVNEKFKLILAPKKKGTPFVTPFTDNPKIAAKHAKLKPGRSLDKPLHEKGHVQLSPNKNKKGRMWITSVTNPPRFAAKGEKFKAPKA